MTDHEKLEDIYNEINALIAQETTYKSASFKVLHKKTKRFLQDYYGKNSTECMVFEKIWYEFHALEAEKATTNPTESVITCKEMLIAIKKLFEDFFKNLSDSEISKKIVLDTNGKTDN